MKQGLSLLSVVADVPPASDRHGQLIFRCPALAGSVSSVCGSSGCSGVALVSCAGSDLVVRQAGAMGYELDSGRRPLLFLALVTAMSLPFIGLGAPNRHDGAFGRLRPAGPSRPIIGMCGHRNGPSCLGPLIFHRTALAGFS
ncbi:hypothetical protein [Nocardia sp. NPDC051981]|uniref:hypothetical protein n=1 Tax=Nocardia sp. NPDC051981 TaxID=3155417 RepID=UPI00342DB4E7